ncbi:unnamed protein product [Victoria cruziana]
MFVDGKSGADKQDERMLGKLDGMVNVGLKEEEKKKKKKRKAEEGKEENGDEVACRSGISTVGVEHLQGGEAKSPEGWKHEEGKRREKKRKKMVEYKILNKADENTVADEEVAGDHLASLHGPNQSGNSKDIDGNRHQMEKKAKKQDRKIPTGIEEEKVDKMKRNEGKRKKHGRNKLHVGDTYEHKMCSQEDFNSNNDQESHGQTRSSENAEIESVADGTGATSMKAKKNNKQKMSKKVREDGYHTGDKKKKKVKEKKSLRKLKGTENSSKSGKSSKHVSFSDNVEVFPFHGDDPPDELTDGRPDGVVNGKRFTKKEDAMVMAAIETYIKEHGLGESGWEKVMNCKKHPEVRNCWKEIGATMPWRPYRSVYIRAHVIYESQRSELRTWTKEEREAVISFVKLHGRKWRKIGDMLGKHRFHVKDLWRRNKSASFRNGLWSQEEYQKLFDMVNIDLQTRYAEEKNTKYGMLRDNIAWEAISDKLATRNQVVCCLKWYRQLASPLVKSGLWANVDDHLLLGRLLELDACNVDDVDWDNLLENRSGELCRKRWYQMTKHIGENRNESFQDQVYLLVSRYCPNLLE